MDELETVIEDVNNINKIECKPIYQLIKDSIKCILDSLKLFFICFKKKSE